MCNLLKPLECILYTVRSLVVGGFRIFFSVCSSASSWDGLKLRNFDGLQPLTGPYAQDLDIFLSNNATQMEMVPQGKPWNKPPCTAPGNIKELSNQQRQTEHSDFPNRSLTNFGKCQPFRSRCMTHQLLDVSSQLGWLLDVGHGVYRGFSGDKPTQSKNIKKQSRNNKKIKHQTYTQNQSNTLLKNHQLYNMKKHQSNERQQKKHQQTIIIKQRQP